MHLNTRSSILLVGLAVSIGVKEVAVGDQRSLQVEYEEGTKPSTVGFGYLSHKDIEALACSPACDIMKCVADNGAAFVSAYTRTSQIVSILAC